MIDVSVVLNIHKGYEFLAPTLTSLRDSINFAQERGLNVELLGVFDCSDERTIHNFSNFDFKDFSNISVIKTTSNSLSAARNLGIDNSSGNYVFTADEDDLISKNSIYQLYMSATTELSSSEVCYFPNYLIAFGEDYYAAEFLDSKNLNSIDFIANNVYTSRIFARRDILNKFKYCEIKSGSGFAFEDWDLINRMYAEGVEFKVAKNTVLFYRIRKNSMLSNSNLVGTDLVPRSKIHSPNNLISRQELIIDPSNLNLSPKKELSENISDKLFKVGEIVNFLLDAIEIEPGIIYEQVRTSKDFSPVPVAHNHWAYAYLTSLKLVANFNFSDVVILPFLNPGGGEKYILQILDSIQKVQKEVNFLILTTECIDANAWKSKLNENFTFLDLRNTFPYLIQEDLEKLLVSLLMIVETQSPRLHLKTSSFGENFVLRYQKVLADKYSIFYYRFSDSVYQINGRELKRPNTLSFLRNALNFLDHVLTDNRNIIENDRNQLGDYYISKYSLIEAYAEEALDKWNYRQPKLHLLWASRISWEKRPQLLPLILKKLKENFPCVEIDIFGESTVQDFLSLVRQTKGLNYKGGFDGFKALNVNDYDMMIYTSYFDGSPNILIEAMSSGIPIVAPDVGGIKDLFPSGYELVPNQVDDDEIAKDYVKKILLNYENWDNVQTEASYVRNLTLSRFSIMRHTKEVEKLLHGESYEIV